MSLNIEPNILLAYAATLILSVAAYAVGYFIACLGSRSQSDIDDFELFFRRMTTGTLTLIVIFAVFRTAGVTLLLGVIILLLVGAMFAPMRKGDNRQWQFALRPFMPSVPVIAGFVMALVVLVTINFLNTSSLTGNIFDINKDYAFYASAANNLMQHGVETLNLDFANPEMVTPEFYRYGELWLTALMGLGGTMSLYYTLLLIVFPFLGSTALIGIGALCERYIGTKRWQTLIGLCVAATITVVYFKVVIFTGGQGEVGPTKFTSLLIQKFYPVLITLVFTILADGWRKIAALCIAGILNPTAIAPILVGSGTYLAISGLWRERRNSDFWRSVAVVVATALWFVAFYTITSVPNPYLKESYSLFDAFRLAMWQYGWSSIAQYATLPVMDFVANTLPYVILLLALPKAGQTLFRTLAYENRCLFYVVGTSLPGFASIWYLRDSIQIYYSVAYPLFIVANSLIVTFVIIRGSTMGRAMAILLVVLNIGFVPPAKSNEKKILNNQFYKSIATELQADTTGHRFAWVDFKELCSVPDLFLRDANYRKPLHDISRFENGYTPVRLDVYDIGYNPSDVGDMQVIASIDNSSFYRYTVKHRLQKNIVEAQNRYIRENKIRYVVVPRGWDWFAGRGFKIRKVIESPDESYSFYILDL